MRYSTVLLICTKPTLNAEKKAIFMDFFWEVHTIDIKNFIYLFQTLFIDVNGGESYSLNLNQSKSTNSQWNLTDLNS